MDKNNNKRKNIFTEAELAKYWQMSERTLQKWRSLGTGPVYIKIGGKVRYTKKAIRTYESNRLFISSSERYAEKGGKE